MVSDTLSLSYTFIFSGRAGNSCCGPRKKITTFTHPIHSLTHLWLSEGLLTYAEPEGLVLREQTRVGYLLGSLYTTGRIRHASSTRHTKLIFPQNVLNRKSKGKKENILTSPGVYRNFR